MPIPYHDHAARGGAGPLAPRLLRVGQLLAAERAELPLESVDMSSRLLDDLHLSSITVGQVVNTVAQSIGISASVAPTNFATATLGELADRTAYAPKQVRIALRRLVEVGVLRTSEAAGMATQYCFGPVAIPGPGVPPVVVPSLASPPPAVVPQQPPVAPPATRAVALRLVLERGRRPAADHADGGVAEQRVGEGHAVFRGVERVRVPQLAGVGRRVPRDYRASK